MELTEGEIIYVSNTLKKEFAHEFHVYGEKFIEEISGSYDLRSPHVRILFVAYIMNKMKIIAEIQMKCMKYDEIAENSVMRFISMTRPILMESSQMREYYSMLIYKLRIYTFVAFVYDVQLAMTSLIGWNKYEKMNSIDAKFEIELEIKPFAIIEDNSESENESSEGENSDLD